MKEHLHVHNDFNFSLPSSLLGRCCVVLSSFLCCASTLCLGPSAKQGTQNVFKCLPFVTALETENPSTFYIYWNIIHTRAMRCSVYLFPLLASYSQFTVFFFSEEQKKWAGDRTIMSDHNHTYTQWHQCSLRLCSVQNEKKQFDFVHFAAVFKLKEKTNLLTIYINCLHAISFAIIPDSQRKP